MHIVVCVKQIPDPEAAFSMLRVDEHTKTVVAVSGLPLVMSPFDEQALEAALRIRETLGEARITAMTAGPEGARTTLKHALAMGADDALLVHDAALEHAGGEATALALSRAITQMGAVDLVLTGRQAADWDAGIVGCGIGELMRLPVVTFASKIEVAGRAVRVERVLEDGFETIEAELPALVTVSNEIGAARKPSLRETMRAARKPLVVKSTSQIGVDADEIARAGRRRFRERVYVPVKQGECELMKGADELAQKLREARLV